MAGDNELVAVRMLVAVAGADFSWVPEEIVHLPAEEAAKWADGERGEYVQPRRETTNAAPRVETTAARPARKAAAPKSGVERRGS